MKHTDYVRKENFVLMFSILFIAFSILILLGDADYSGHASSVYPYSTVTSDSDSLSRSFSSDSAAPNSVVIVTLTKSFASSHSALLIEEYVPSGFTIVDSGLGTVVGNTIRWGELQNVISGAFTYSVKVSSVSSSYEFSGLYSIDGATTASISGHNFLNVTDESSDVINVSKSIYVNNTDINYSANSSKNNGNLSNVTFNNNRGRILFNNVRLSKNLSINNSVMNISHGKIFIDSAILPEFNRNANLEFYDIFMNNPQIHRDGLLCDSQCYNKNYDKNAGIFYVTVSGFSEYDVVEGPYCGDNSCNNDETCSSCSADCGSCPVHHSSGGSGDSPYVPPVVQNITNSSNGASIVSTADSSVDSNVSMNVTDETNNIAVVESVKESSQEIASQQILDASQNLESTDKSGNSLTFILIGVLIVIFIISFIAIMKYRTRSLSEFKTTKTLFKPDIFMERNINYIKSMRERGYADEYIKNRLRSVGWTEDKIEYLFKNIR
jgi:hypothetical protein